MRLAIVVSRFNQNISQRLLDGALKTLRQNKVSSEKVNVFWVPGAFEIPLVCLRLAKSKKYDAIIALGCVLQGETSHNQYISLAASLGITFASLSTGVPISFGILTPRTMKQALARSGRDTANKGAEAAEAALEMITIFKNGR